VDRRHGTERALAELLERLARDYGCEIHLYAQRAEDLRLSDLGAAVPTRAGKIFWRKVPRIPGPHVVQFVAWMLLNSFLRKRHQRSGPPYDLVLSPGVNSLDADIVIVHALFTRLRELAREKDEDSTAGADFFHRLHRRIYYLLLTQIEKRVYTDPKVVLAAVSPRAAHLLDRYFQRKDVRVIPNGVDSSYFTPAARAARRYQARQSRAFSTDDFVLLLIGNDWHTKGLPTVMEAMATLQNLPLQLLVVGNDNRESYEKHAVRLGVQARCRWEAPRVDVLDCYAAADAYVSPSREDSFALPVAEAMACGLPTVTSIFAGVADLIRDQTDGFVLQEPRSAKELARCIEVLWADGDLRQRIGAAAALRASAWTWDRHAAAAWDLIQNELRRIPASMTTNR
jgi:glycosyltransferase involved in cell wall biosynthesis